MFHLNNPDQNLNKYTRLTLSRKDSNNSILNNLSNRIAADAKKHSAVSRKGLGAADIDGRRNIAVKLLYLVIT